MDKTWNTEKSWTVRPSIIVLSAFIVWFVTAAIYATVFEY